MMNHPIRAETDTNTNTRHNSTWIFKHLQPIKRTYIISSKTKIPNRLSHMVPAPTRHMHKHNQAVKYQDNKTLVETTAQTRTWQNRRLSDMIQTLQKSVPALQPAEFQCETLFFSL